jgi:hypothetical protein
MGCNREVRSVAKDSGGMEVEASGAIPSFVLGLVCPQVRDLTVGEDTSLASAHNELLLGLVRDVGFAGKQTWDELHSHAACRGLLAVVDCFLEIRKQSDQNKVVRYQSRGTSERLAMWHKAAHVPVERIAADSQFVGSDSHAAFLADLIFEIALERCAGSAANGERALSVSE